MLHPNEVGNTEYLSTRRQDGNTTELCYLTELSNHLYTYLVLEEALWLNLGIYDSLSESGSESDSLSDSALSMHALNLGCNFSQCFFIDHDLLWLPIPIFSFSRSLYHFLSSPLYFLLCSCFIVLIQKRKEKVKQQHGKFHAENPPAYTAMLKTRQPILHPTVSMHEP